MDSNSFTIPPRGSSAIPGSVFAELIMRQAGAEREQSIFHELAAGNVPEFMREKHCITLTGNGQTIVLEVLPDVLCIGSDDDFLRIPMMPRTAQKVANLFSASLITPLLSDAIWKQADVRINPVRVAMSPTSEMVTTKWYVDQDARIERERNGRSGLIVGHKKDIVLANSLSLPEFKNKCVAIYGWHLPSGQPIQGLNPSKGARNTHDLSYVDYSHGVRLISKYIGTKNGPITFLEAAVDAMLSPLLNTGGPLPYLHYPTE